MAMLSTPFLKEEYDALMEGLNIHVAHIKKGEKRQADCQICRMQNDSKGA